MLDNSKIKKSIKSLYGKECILSTKDFISLYNINIDGLTAAEADLRIKEYGLNEISQAKQKKWYNYFLESLFSPFNSILLRNCNNSILYRRLSFTYT